MPFSGTQVKSSHDSDQLFMSKYKLYLPTEGELRAEIETQKEIYYLQHKDGE